MLSWLIKHRIDAFERAYDYDMTYARELLATDTRAVLAVAKLDALGRYRKDLPRDVLFAIKLTAAVAEDCGPCTQLVVTMALQAGVAARTIASVLGGEGAMSEDVHLGVRFARAVVAHAAEADALRDELVRRWGRRALITASFAIVVARAYPTLKYALGHGKACQRVVIAGEPVVVRDAMRGAARGAA